MEIENKEQSTVALQAVEADAYLSLIERVARDPNADISKLEKMIDLQERVMNRNAEQAFNSAYAQMQSEMPVITERGEIKVGNDVRSKYGLLEDINEAIKPVLQKYGFGISFRINQSEGRIKVTAILSHRDGHSEKTEFETSSDTSGSKNAVQAQGSAVSYGKRYTLCALLNISTRGEDDDGQSFTQVIPLDAAVQIDELITSSGASKQKFLEHMKVESVRDIRSGDYLKAITALNSYKKKKEGEKK